MSEFKIEVVRVGKIGKHPNADSLSITHVRGEGGYPVILKTGEFQENDLAVYVPVDSLVPGDDPRWGFLDGHLRIKARRLRGVFSLGLLTKADPSWVEGQDVVELLRIKKYEPPESLVMGGESEACPFDFPKYTDIDGLRRFPDVLQVGEEVVLTEKVHGCNGRWVWHDGRLWAGSHTQIKKENPDNIFWKIADQYCLREKLQRFPDFVLYGEPYGRVQDLHYGLKNALAFVAFDVMDLKTYRYLDYGEFFDLMYQLELPTAPLIHRGPWSNDLREYAEGKSLIVGADNVREGFVVRPLKERFDERIGRVCLKLHGQGYLLRKE